MRRATILTFAAATGLLAGAASGQLATEDMNTLTPEDLVAALLGGDLGPNISNIQFTGANGAAGTFSGGTGIIGFEDGIILSSGNVADVVAQNGLNQLEDATTAHNTPGDSDLDALINESTNDAAVLEFDFACDDVDTISFQYVFTSEEYNEFVDSGFNDVFAFFVNGENIAIVPGTESTPVSIDNVNCGNPFGSGPGSNCDLFINNMCGAGGLDDYPCAGNVETEMDGLTVVLTAAANIKPGTNHIKLAIADVGDETYDSNVFIRGGSLICGDISGLLWEDLAGGVNGSVFDIERFNVQKNGPTAAGEPLTDNVFFGGSFDQAGNVNVGSIARFDGVMWHDVGGGVGGTFPIINDMIVWNDALYVTGNFTTAGGVSASRIARWDGDSWSALGAGLNSTGWALEVVDEGKGDALYVGGAFTQAGGQPASGLARWDGQSWSEVDGGVGGGFFRVYALKQVANSLYVGGRFTQAGDINASNIARWNPAQGGWSALDGGVSGGAVRVFESAPVFEKFINAGVGVQELILVGGQFETAGGVSSQSLAAWNSFGGKGGEWFPVDDLFFGVGGAQPVIEALELLSDDTLLLGGEFALSPAGPAVNLAHLPPFAKEEDELEPFRGGADAPVNAIKGLPANIDVTSTGDGLPSCDWLYVGGAFDNLGFSPVANVGFWNQCLEPPQACIDGAGECCFSHGGIGCNDESCCMTVCAQDPFCCDVQWDGLCADDANELCEVCEDVTPQPCVDGSGDCCSAHDGAGCDEESCCAIVCDVDPSCCDDVWNSECASLANDLCESCDVPEPVCPGDLDASGEVNVDDLLIVLNNWGACPTALVEPVGKGCPGDATGDGEVNVDDLLIVLNNWGACPD